MSHLSKTRWKQLESVYLGNYYQSQNKNEFQAGFASLLSKSNWPQIYLIYLASIGLTYHEKRLLILCEAKYPNKTINFEDLVYNDVSRYRIS